MIAPNHGFIKTRLTPCLSDGYYLKGARGNEAGFGGLGSDSVFEACGFTGGKSSAWTFSGDSLGITRSGVGSPGGFLCIAGSGSCSSGGFTGIIGSGFTFTRGFGLIAGSSTGFMRDWSRIAGSIEGSTHDLDRIAGSEGIGTGSGAGGEVPAGGSPGGWPTEDAESTEWRGEEPDLETLRNPSFRE